MQWPVVTEWMRRSAFLGSVVLAAACGGGAKVPPPDGAFRQYVSALEKSDAKTLRTMMTRSGRAEYSTRDIERLLKRDADDFRIRARQLKEGARPGSGEATVFLLGGRSAALELQDGHFWVRSAGLVPPMPRTPEEAAEYLRSAVEARDYSRIERTLSADARDNFARAFEELEESLSQLSSAIVNVREDSATIEFLDGRVITLRLEGTAWRVESFE